jgi:hypothetical protein
MSAHTSALPISAMESTNQGSCFELVCTNISSIGRLHMSTYCIGTASDQFGQCEVCMPRMSAQTSTRSILAMESTSHGNCLDLVCAKQQQTQQVLGLGRVAGW